MSTLFGLLYLACLWHSFSIFLDFFIQQIYSPTILLLLLTQEPNMNAVYVIRSALLKIIEKRFEGLLSHLTWESPLRRMNQSQDGAGVS